MTRNILRVIICVTKKTPILNYYNWRNKWTPTNLRIGAQLPRTEPSSAVAVCLPTVGELTTGMNIEISNGLYTFQLYYSKTWLGTRLKESTSRKLKPLLGRWATSQTRVRKNTFETYGNLASTSSTSLSG